MIRLRLSSAEDTETGADDEKVVLPTLSVSLSLNFVNSVSNVEDGYGTEDLVVEVGDEEGKMSSLLNRDVSVDEVAKTS